MAVVEDKQLALCIRWLEGVALDAKLFGQPSIQTGA